MAESRRQQCILLDVLSAHLPSVFPRPLEHVRQVENVTANHKVGRADIVGLDKVVQLPTKRRRPIVKVESNHPIRRMVDIPITNTLVRERTDSRVRPGECGTVRVRVLRVAVVGL